MAEEKSNTKKVILIIIAVVIIILACLYGCIAKGKSAPVQTTSAPAPTQATIESAEPAQPAPQPAPAPKPAPAPAPEPQKSIFPDNSADYPVTEK